MPWDRSPGDHHLVGVRGGDCIRYRTAVSKGRSYVKSTEQTHATQVTAESHEFSCLYKSAREETCMTQVKSAWGAQHRIPIFTVFAIRSTGEMTENSVRA